MNMRDYSTLHFDINSSKGRVLFIVDLQFTFIVGFSTMSKPHTLKSV